MSRIFWAVVLGIFAIAAVVALARGQEAPPIDHYGPGHWYPEDCCSRVDCRPLSDSEVQLESTGFLLSDGALIVYGEERESLDGKYHRCDYSGKLRTSTVNGVQRPCFFAPGRES